MERVNPSQRRQLQKLCGRCKTCSKHALVIDKISTPLQNAIGVTGYGEVRNGQRIRRTQRGIVLACEMESVLSALTDETINILGLCRTDPSTPRVKVKGDRPTPSRSPARGAGKQRAASRERVRTRRQSSGNKSTMALTGVPWLRHGSNMSTMARTGRAQWLRDRSNAQGSTRVGLGGITITMQLNLD